MLFIHYAKFIFIFSFTAMNDYATLSFPRFSVGLPRIKKWGVALCDAVGSERFKLLYDVYHLQIMEGDVISTIRKYHPYIAHYHTGGVPGRNEIDDTQELNYPAIMRVIAETGFQGYVAQEFIPKQRDPLESLAQAVRICDI